MDTTQKNREEAAARRPRQNASAAVAPPDSAQQRNGAARTEQEQRSKAKRPAPEQKDDRKAPTKPRTPKAPVKKKKPLLRKAVAKKPAAAKTAPVKKQKSGETVQEIPERKLAYGNSKPKKKSSLTLVAEKVRKKSNKPQQPAPAVIYTDPAPFNRNRFLIQMGTVVAVVAAFVLALSVFFKVEKITVTGEEVYSKWAIREASGISTGDNLLTFSHARAGAQIMAKLPYVETVRFGIKLPDTVNIIVEEAEVAYAIKDSNGQWWLMSSSGRVVAQSNQTEAANHTQVLGFALESPAVNLQAVAAEQAPTETDASGEFIPVTVTGAQKLSVALQILKALEANDIVGSAASVDVTRTEDILLWYGNQYQVNLGDSSRLEYKIDCMNDVILQMSEYQSGILDISFTHWPDQVGYTPFA